MMESDICISEHNSNDLTVLQDLEIEIDKRSGTSDQVHKCMYTLILNLFMLLIQL